jgi:hypothetical protein
MRHRNSDGASFSSAQIGVGLKKYAGSWLAIVSVSDEHDEQLEAQPWGYEVLGAKHNRLLGRAEHEGVKYEDRTSTTITLGLVRV